MDKLNKFSWADTPSEFAFPIAKAGYVFIMFFAFATIIFALLGLTYFALSGLFITIFICYFFRDPDRVIPNESNAIVSPADGKVIIVDEMNFNPYFEGKCIKISIFMSIFNVHVNRVCHEGKIIDIIYNPGNFFSANLDKASKDNEQNAIVIETKNIQKICMVQIAGLIARRIICRLQKGDSVDRGRRFGMICFGSRLDVYIPKNVDIAIKVGDKVFSGTSILAYLKTNKENNNEEAQENRYVKDL